MGIEQGTLPGCESAVESQTEAPAKQEFETRLNHTFVSFVLPSLKVFAARANFPVVIQTISVQKRIHRGDAEYAEKRIL